MFQRDWVWRAKAELVCGARGAAIVAALAFLAGCPSSECRFNSECAAGSYCSDGSCATACTPETETDDCGRGERCNRFGMCVATPDGGSIDSDGGAADALVSDAASDSGGSDAPPLDGGMDETDAGGPDAGRVIPDYTSISAGNTSAFSAPIATFTRAPYNVELHDDRDEFDPAAGRFTTTHAGTYQVCAAVRGDDPTTLFEVDLYSNGARERGFAYGAGAVAGCRVIRLASGDFVEVFVHQSAVASATFASNAQWNWLTIDEIPSGGSSVAVNDIAGFDVARTTFTRVPYAAEAHDDLSEFDPATGRFTATHAGLYQVCASAFSGDGTVAYELDLFVNGGRERGFALGNGEAVGCRTVRLVSADQLDVRVYQDSRATARFDPNVYWNWLTIDEMASPSAASAGDVTTFSVSSTTSTPVPYGSEVYDRLAELDPSNGRFVATNAGDYQICGSAFVGDRALRFELEAFVNDVRASGLAVGTGFARGCRVVRVGAGSTLDVRLRLETAASAVVSPNLYWNWLTVSAQ